MALSSYPPALEALIESLKSLPGVGRRSSERMALSIMKWPQARLELLAESLKNLHSKIAHCPLCGNFSEPGHPCMICSSSLRDKSVICVVEDVAQIRTMESGSFFKGLYHVLGGHLSPLEGKGPETLNLAALSERVKSADVREVILALSADIEGQATSIYIAEFLKDSGVTVSRPAQGLPAGSDISYADAATIAAAMNGRVKL